MGDIILNGRVDVPGGLCIAVMLSRVDTEIKDSNFDFMTYRGGRSYEDLDRILRRHHGYCTYFWAMDEH